MATTLMGTKTRPARTVVTRRIAFDHDREMPKYFFDGDLMMSHILAVLSATFPKGEDFFVESVRAVRSQLTDDGLRAQVAGFIGQEAMHGREHERLNHVLARLGYPTSLIDHVTGAFLGLYRRVAPNAVQLATTAALEHYTAVLAEQLLDDDAFGAFDVPDELRAMFRWHALEECEHKAVAFDAFRDRYDSEEVRIATMQVATALVVVFALPLLVMSVASDRRSWNPVRLARSVIGLRHSPLARWKILTNLARYSAPGFHPDDRQTDALLERWREQLFGPTGTLTSQLMQPVLS
jgi:predicted metal-dependent hydrolase